MPCYSPLSAYQCQVTRTVSFNPYASRDAQPITLPCSQCVGCRLERSRQWAMRCMHEASLYENNCFITLTYNNTHLPADGSLNYVHFQEFMKRFRFHHKGSDPVSTLNAEGLSVVTYPIRFYMAGEYGEQLGRPHFHACIFNFDFDDRRSFKTTDSGSRLYTSKKLEALWPFGYSSIGDVNFQSAAYVARYIMKKVTGRAASAHYKTSIDSETGEITGLTPEFNKMSLKPGIGSRWLDKYKSDVYPNDYVIVNGRKCKPPRYYDSKYATENPYEFDELQFERQLKSQLYLDDNTPDRLKVKEQVTLAKLSKLKRNKV